MVQSRGDVELRIVALVPARGGSKGLPGKNLAQIDGASLIRRAVRIAQATADIDEVVVSSDDDDILDEAVVCGARAERRATELAQDATPTLDVVRDFLASRPEVDAIVLLQPTSPLRSVEDVQSCLDALRTASSAATVTRCEHPPEWSFRLTAQQALEPVLDWDALVTRRQEAVPAYRLNGAVYASRAQRLRDGSKLVDADTIAVVMPAERSVDIDDELDLTFASLLARRVSPDQDASPTGEFGR